MLSHRQPEEHMAWLAMPGSSLLLPSVSVTDAAQAGQGMEVRELG